MHAKAKLSMCMYNDVVFNYDFAVCFISTV